MTVDKQAAATRQWISDPVKVASIAGSVGVVVVAIALFASAAGVRNPADARPGHGARSTSGGDATQTVVQRAGRSTEVETSFGVPAVHQPDFVAGVPARALAGQNHGIQDHVTVDRQLVQVPITLYNGSEDPVRYDSDRFKLVLRSARGAWSDPQPAASSTLAPGRLQPKASIDAVLGFVVPRNGASLVLVFHDKRANSHRIALSGTGSQYRARPGDYLDHKASTHATGHKH